MSEFTIFNNNVNAPVVSVTYLNTDGVSVVANVKKNERRVTKGIKTESIVKVRWKLKEPQTIEHKNENERVLLITHGHGELLGLNWAQE